MADEQTKILDELSPRNRRWALPMVRTLNSLNGTARRKDVVERIRAEHKARPADSGRFDGSAFHERTTRTTTHIAPRFQLQMGMGTPNLHDEPGKAGLACGAPGR